MPDLSCNTAGIKSPNPFWLASAPPTNSLEQVKNAFEAGWGGVVWKTLGTPVTNVSSRYAAVNIGSRRVMGLNNIELISDRGVEENLKEIAWIKKHYPNNALVVSLMVEGKDEWEEMLRRVEDTGADGVELNFGCPHGMCERGMGSSVGQEPQVLQEITSWVKGYTKLPVLVKLTPNIADITEPGLAAQAGGADGVSLINTIKSLIGVDLDDFTPYPKLRNGSTNGGYCGPAVKPIALHMVASLARHPEFHLPLSGIGGIGTWQDAAEFIALGCSSVQVCTAAMHYGFRIVEDMISGLENYLKDKGFSSVQELQSKAVNRFKDWGDLDMNYHVTAKIDESKCIGCQLCYIACKDGSHDCIDLRADSRVPEVRKHDCVGCNLCSLVCPVDDCITMVDSSHSPKEETWKERVAKGIPPHPDGVFASSRS